MKVSKKYSVLMSVYKNDNPLWLTEAIKSMLLQTVKPDQFVIIVDGPVDDEITNVLETFRSQDADLFLIVYLTENMGLANALNTGLCKCKYNLIARMDADDIALPDRCAKQLELFERFPELGVCGCNIQEFTENKRLPTKRVVPRSYREIKAFSRRRQPFNHPTVMYKKDVIIDNGAYSTQLRRKEDFDLFSRLLCSNVFCLNVPEVLYLYRTNDQNYMRRKTLVNLQSALDVYKLHYKRKGCSCLDLFVMICAEIAFYILPLSIMKFLSDKFLRQK